MKTSLVRRVITTLGLTAVLATGAVVVTPQAAQAACTDIDISFARGSGEPQGFGIVGRPLVTALTSQLSGYTVSSYAVVYGADLSQTSAGPGSTDLVNHITSVAAACPDTRFVLGGYSQGATVVDKALGIRTSGGDTGSAIPAALAGRVSAVTVFGNPLGLQGGATIASSSSVYGARSADYCNTSDSVCGSQPKNGTGSHTSYPSNGSIAAAAQFAATLVRSGTTPTTSPTTPPTTPAGTCVRDDTVDHVDAGRARDVFDRAYAVGSRDPLGRTSRFNIVSLRETTPGTWTRVEAC